MSNLLIMLAILVGLFSLPVFWRLAIAQWGSIFQIYTALVFNFYPSLSLLTTLSLSPTLIQYKRTFTQLPILLLLILMTIQIVSLLWSADMHLGLATILYELPFLILYIVSFNIAAQDPEKTIKLIKVYAILSLIPVTIILLFSAFHELNVAFLRSHIARYFVNPHTLEWYLATHNKALWLGKPRGFLINPDVGGGYFGVCALIFWGVGIYCQSRWLKLIAALNWMTLFLTFSVAAIGLAISLPLIALSLFVLFEKKTICGKSAHLMFRYFWLLVILFLTIIFSIKPELLLYISSKFESRLVFWRVAASFIPHHVFLGQGYGGWLIEYEKYRALWPNPFLTPGLPPHNTLIQLWSQNGIMTPLLYLLFMYSIFNMCWKAFKSSVESQTKWLVLFITASCAWVFLQGMGENWGVMGEIHIQPLIAVALGLIIGMHDRTREKNHHA